VLSTAIPAGRLPTVIEAQVLRARALDALGQSEASSQALVQALELAEPESIARAFIEEGSVIAAGLERLGHRSASASVIGYAGELRTRLGSNGKPYLPEMAPQGRAPDTCARGVLIEPLSPRELEVLHLLAEGFSNAEVAGRLFLSVNTLRAHTSNIYQKLDVHSRVQAVHRARSLGLLTDA
jgi:LuxR family maltose regulon positive regulatory protein